MARKKLKENDDEEVDATIEHEQESDIEEEIVEKAVEP